MRNLYPLSKNRITSKNKVNDQDLNKTKVADINVMLNKVKLDQKKESRKKILFTVATSLGVFVFGILVF